MSATSSHIEIDLSEASTPSELHTLLGAALGFPAWHGCNWDSFADCASDPKLSELPASLCIVGITALSERMPREAALLRSCLAELAADRPDCSVSWVC